MNTKTGGASAPNNNEASPPAGDGTVTNTPEGQGTIQREPKPEDYPASARITPAAQQLNSALSQVVGAPVVPEQLGKAGDDLKDAGDRTDAAAARAIERTDKVFEEKTKIDEAAAKEDAAA